MNLRNHEDADCADAFGGRANPAGALDACAGLAKKGQMQTAGAADALAGCRKGQTNSIDAVLALLIFMGLVVFFMAFWSNSISSMKSAVLKNRYEYAAISVSDMLVRGTGLPSKWEGNPEGVQEIGLAASENVLSSAKLSNFSNMPYANAKRLLGIDSEFFFYVENLNGSRLYEAGNSTMNGKTSATITRYAILNGKNVRMKLSVYG